MQKRASSSNYILNKKHGLDNVHITQENENVHPCCGLFFLNALNEKY